MYKRNCSADNEYNRNHSGNCQGAFPLLMTETFRIFNPKLLVILQVDIKINRINKMKNRDKNLKRKINFSINISNCIFYKFIVITT